MAGGCFHCVAFALPLRIVLFTEDLEAAIAKAIRLLQQCAPESLAAPFVSASEEQPPTASHTKGGLEGSPDHQRAEGTRDTTGQDGTQSPSVDGKGLHRVAFSAHKTRSHTRSGRGCTEAAPGELLCPPQNVLLGLVTPDFQFVDPNQAIAERLVDTTPGGGGGGQRPKKVCVLKMDLQVGARFIFF